MAPLEAIFDAAKQFGLSDEEAWQTLEECLYLDEVTAAFAARILAKERASYASRSGGTGKATRVG
jgi:hypothetical protein